MTKPKKKPTKTQVISVWCPNCGIPRTATMPLKKYIAIRSKLLYYCSACGLTVEISKPSKEKKKKPEDKGELSMKDLTGALKTVRTIKALGGSVIR